ncbi:MAG: hypothetical protein JO099_24035 [Acidobacteriia bacterium]|nr:hypothetical protein [Terriglobia bacterium]
MKPAVWRSGAAALSVTFAGTLMWAHHEFASEYDDKKPVTFKGIVSNLEWSDPHVYVYVDVMEPGRDAARAGTWAVEFASPIDLKKVGWTRDSVRVGDAVTAEGSAARDASQRLAGKVLILAGGKRLSEPTDAQLTPPHARQAKATPRWPDGHPRLGAVPGEIGYWSYPSASMLVENGANIKTDSEGLLANLADADKVAPFQPWAKGLFLYRQRALLKDDPMASCLPPGGPRQFQARYGFGVLDQPERQRIFFMSAGGNRNWRLVYLDGRELPTGDDVTPTYFGYSVGKWEGDTLVLRTSGFNERFWFTNGGLPHTEALKLTERISRPDFNTLRYEVTVDDPGAYTRTWSGGWSLQWVAEELPEYFCQDNDKDPEHMVGK